jgi:hypothetical protein
MTKLLFALLLPFCLLGCSDLDTTYGARTGDSINGVRVLRAELEARTDLRDAYLLSPHSADADLLFYFATDNNLPDFNASDWLQKWLLEGEESPRQVVIILRDGNVTAPLCRRWAAEMRKSAQVEMANRLDARARAEQNDHVNVPDQVSDTDLFVVATRETAPVRTVDGLGLTEAPTLLTLGAWLEPEDDGDVLIAADDEPFAVAWPMGENAQLLVVANATALVDGAMPDPRARRLLAALLDEIARFHGDKKPRAVWLGSLRVREADPPDLNMLSFLWMPPFAWPLWHLLALLLVVVLGRAAWLGRKEALRDRETARFSRHVDALATHMARAAVDDHAVAQDAAVALAAAMNRPPPPQTVRSADDAVQWLAHTSTPAAGDPNERK